MKIACSCGATIVDQGDDLPHKAHLLPDQGWLALLEQVDAAIESAPATAAGREAACMRVRSLIGAAARGAWQCGRCGRVYLDDAGRVAREFVPASASAAVFASRG